MTGVVRYVGGAVLGIAAIGAVGFAPLTAQAADDALPAAPGRDLVYGKCQTCHSLQYLADSAGIQRNQWASVLDDMALYGLVLDEAQHDRVLDYLATYLGPDPPPSGSTKTGSEHADSTINGKQVFEQQCSACHQSNGTGRPGSFPPLADNPDIFLSGAYPALVVVNGLAGRINVDGNDYDGRMPAQAFLSDRKIAAVVRYVRDAWSNREQRPAGMPELTADDVAAARKQSLDADTMHDYREQHARN